MNAPASQSEANHGHKLLTREDLVALEIPAADILQWLLAGSLCEAGSLPGDAGAGTVAVFAVPDPELRSELAERLAAIGRTDVALTRPQARAEVVRAVMAQRGLTPVATPLVEVGEVEVAAEATAEVGGDVEIEAASANAAGNEEADFFDADALVQELDAWTEPEANDPDGGEIEGELETMSATPEPIDAGATDGTTDEDGSATLLEDLTGAADPEAADTDADMPEEASGAPEEVASEPVGDATLTEEAFTDEPPSSAATTDDAIVSEQETAAVPEAATDATPDANTDTDADLADAAAELMAATAGSTDENGEPSAAASDAEADLGAESDEPFIDHDALVEDPVDKPPVEEAPPAESLVNTSAAEGDALPAEQSLMNEPTDDENSAEDSLPEEREELPEAEASDDVPSTEPLNEDASVDEPSFEEQSFEEQSLEEPSFAEPAVEETPAAAAMVESPPEDSAPPAAATNASASASEATTEEAMTRVESFLGELRGALVDLAQRPPESAQPVDMQPLVAAVGEFGQRVEHGVAVGVHAAMLNGGKQAEAPAPIQYVKTASSGQEITMLSVAFLILCWSGILWFKTGNAVLAIGTLVGANVIGCCLLARRR